MFRRVKIVCTIGPACESQETLEVMVHAGMNVARFNFSHGNREDLRRRVETVRRAAAVITEAAGLTSHAAIAAVSLGKPAVVGVKEATAVLSDGGTVTVDVARGLVYRGETQAP